MTNHDPANEYRFSGFRLDVLHKRLLDPDGEIVTLSSRPFDVLLALVQRSGAILSREELMETVWPKLVVEEHNLTQAICLVRKALNDTTTESHYIRTVPGRGYCFIATVETCAPEAGLSGLPAKSAASAVSAFIRRHIPAAATAVVLLLTLAAVTLKPESAVVPAATPPSTSAPAPLGVSDIPRPDSRIRNSVAVLPLATLSAEGDAPFASGLHDEIISQLTQVGSLHVIARSSVLSLLEQGLSTLDITRVLRVESILSGTIRLMRGRARISLQLLDVRTGITLWSHSYDVNRGDPAEMLPIQQDIATNVAAALRMEMRPAEQADFSGLPPDAVEAYRYNLAAQKAHHLQNYAEEWRLARKALALAPDFYDALYTFASVNLVLVTNPLPGMTSREHFELALSHASRMVDVAPERDEGYALKARSLAGSRDWGGAAAAIATLADANASLTNLEYVAPPLMALGEFERAIAIYEANLDAELLNPYGRGFLLVALELAGRRDEARHQYEIGQELHSQWWGDGVNVFLALGRDEQVQDVDQLVGVSAELKQVLARLDDPDAVRGALAHYRNKAVKRPMEARYYAALAAELGEHDLAVELLRLSIQEMGSSVFWAWLPVFDETREQASFRDLLRDSGLVAYWQTHGWPAMCHPAGADFRCDWRAYPFTLHTRSTSSSVAGRK